MKRILSLLAVTVLLTVCASALKFTDVPENAWYYEDVKGAVESGIVNGKSDTEYKPNDNLTYAEAIKLAACMHQLYTEGNVSINGGTPWYQPYIEYCVDKGIITVERADLYSYNDNATRAGYMEIFAKALPDEALRQINNVPDDSIPDVPSSKAYAPAVYKLYRAGILQGVDDDHNCKPLDNIKRSEVAAIITRMMNENKRVWFNMGATGEEIKGEGEHEHKLVPKADIASHYDECSVCFVIFDVEDHTFKNGKCTVCGYDEYVEPSEKEPEDELDEPEEDNSKVVETPDMYPEFLIIGQPVYQQVADDGEEVKYWVIADGGKEPYTYKWYTYNGRYGNVPVENGEYIKGADTDTLEFTYSVNNPYANSSFLCEVTDALGSKAESKKVKAPEAVFVGVPEANKVNYDGGFILPVTVQSGSILAGQEVILYVKELDIYCIATVERLEMFGKSLDEAEAGNRAGFLFKNVRNLTDKKYIESFYGSEVCKKLNSMDSFVVKLPLTVYGAADAYADLGDNASFTVQVLGGRTPYTYSWSIGLSEDTRFTVIPESNNLFEGQKTDTLTYKKVTADIYEGLLRCTVTDADGVSLYANRSSRVKPITEMHVSKQPDDVKAEYGDTVHFSAEGVAPRGGHVTSYQWQIKTDNHKDFVNIDKADTWARGFNTRELEIDVEMSDFVSHSKYRCVITSADGKSVITREAKLTPKSLYIIVHPKSPVAKHGEIAKFTVVAEGGKAPYTYRWQMACPKYDGEFRDIGDAYANFEGQNTATLGVIVNDKELTDEYKFRCVVTDATGRKVTSRSQTVTLTADASVDFQKKSESKDDMIVIMG